MIYNMYFSGAPPVVSEKPKSSQEIPLFSNTNSSSASRPPEPPRHPTVERYPPVAALAGEQLLARSGFQPYRPEDR